MRIQSNVLDDWRSIVLVVNSCLGVFDTLTKRWCHRKRGGVHAAVSIFVAWWGAKTDFVSSRPTKPRSSHGPEARNAQMLACGRRQGISKSGIEMWEMQHRRLACCHNRASKQEFAGISHLARLLCSPWEERELACLEISHVRKPFREMVDLGLLSKRCAQGSCFPICCRISHVLTRLADAEQSATAAVYP